MSATIIFIALTSKAGVSFPCLHGYSGEVRYLNCISWWVLALKNIP